MDINKITHERSGLQSYNIMALNPIPDGMPNERIRLLDNCTVTIDVSKTCQETWQVAVITVDKLNMVLCGVGRVLVHVAHGYGG